MKFKRISDGDATAYTIGVERLDPEQDPELEPAGYHGEATLYVVMTGAETLASHDRHRIGRELPGEAGWVVDELRAFERSVFDV
jgi:hypothetical protein